MFKKISILILVTLLSFMLYSCVKEIKDSPYISNNSTEEQIIKTANEIADATVTIDINSTHTQLNDYTTNRGQAIIFKSETSVLINTYYALTTAEIAKQSSQAIILKNPNGIESKIENYMYNNDFHFGIIKFKSSNKLNKVKLKQDDKDVANFIGQQALSIGTAYDLSNVDSFKVGTITSNNYKEHFITHDAASNLGELGSGLFNKEGYLLGLNIHKEFTTTTPNGEYNYYGYNIALPSSIINSALASVDINNMTNSAINNEYFTTKSNNNATINKDDYETKNSIVFNETKNSVVKIITEDYEYSGLLINNSNNVYTILTTIINSSSVVINLNGKIYESSDVSIHNNLFSTIKFETNDSLEIYNKINLTSGSGIELVAGQKVLGIGYLNQIDNLSMSNGTLSKVEVVNENTNKTDLFMHDAKLNLGLEGAPIFNLNGDLIGIYTKKIAYTSNNDTNKLVAEGLGFGVNINNIISVLSNTELETVNSSAKKYTSNVEIEKDILDVVDKTLKTSLTIIAGSSLGSGVLVKKEIFKDKYMYSVLTNFHVVEGATEISVSFNSNPTKQYSILDFQTTKSHDMAILRFTSSEELEIAESVFIDESNVKPTVGQTIISIGTPLSLTYFGYITTGVISLDAKGYKYGATPEIAKLGLLHDSSINPGNSGGPLFDLNGRLIGINVAKLKPYISATQGSIPSENVGFALNINILYKNYENYKESRYTKLERQPKLGFVVQTIEDFLLYFPEYKDYYSSYNGYMITDFDYTRDAYKVFEIGDLLLEIDGRVINELSTITDVIGNGGFGSSYKFKVLRKDSTGTIKEVIVAVKLT